MPTRKDKLESIIQDTIKELEKEVKKHRFMTNFDNEIPKNWINWRVEDKP